MCPHCLLSAAWFVVVSIPLLGVVARVAISKLKGQNHCDCERIDTPANSKVPGSCKDCVSCREQLTVTGMS